MFTGCAGLPVGVDRPVSAALTDLSSTRLGGISAASVRADQPDLSGMRLLPDGTQAFEALVSLVNAAERTIDAQYYQIADDASGQEFLRGLREAAARGVRVRLLIDDLHAAGLDEMLVALAGRANVEVRTFNPLVVRDAGVALRVLLSLHDFDRINRRMHNKLLVVDNAMAISGGRNIADEYFGRGDQSAHFIDMDVLSAGPVVTQLSTVFDGYWNSELAYPIQSLAGDEARSGGARLEFEEAAAKRPVATPPIAPSDALGQGSVGSQLAAGRLMLHSARVKAVSDTPRKAAPAASQVDGAVMRANLDLLQSARSDVLVASPYFVPGPRTLDILAQSSASQVKVSILTNSLGTTDEPLVHRGYSRYRRALIEMGVALYELTPGTQAPRPATTESRGSLGRLHTKVAVVDGRWLSIGSMNMDRRSAHCNTEMGLVIDSPELAGQVAQLLRQDQQHKSYRVRSTGPQKSLQWTVEQEGAHRAVFTAEPYQSWGAQLRMSLISIFVSEELL